MSRAVDHFEEGLFQLIERMRYEYSLSYAECVGALELVKNDIIAEAREPFEEEGDEDDECDE